MCYPLNLNRWRHRTATFTKENDEIKMLVIRPLSESDAKPFWGLRLRALKDNPDAFGASYEEEKETPIENIASRFQHV
jgi:hypothetical protein